MIDKNETIPQHETGLINRKDLKIEHVQYSIYGIGIHQRSKGETGHGCVERSDWVILCNPTKYQIQLDNILIYFCLGWSSVKSIQRSLGSHTIYMYRWINRHHLRPNNLSCPASIFLKPSSSKWSSDLFIWNIITGSSHLNSSSPWASGSTPGCRSSSGAPKVWVGTKLRNGMIFGQNNNILPRDKGNFPSKTDTIWRWNSTTMQEIWNLKTAHAPWYQADNFIT